MNEFKTIEREIFDAIDVHTGKVRSVSLDAIYRDILIPQLRMELQHTIHEQLVKLANISTKGDDETLINELCRYILHMSSTVPIEPQWIQNHKIR